MIFVVVFEGVRHDRKRIGLESLILITNRYGMRLRRGFKGFFKKWKKELNLDIESKLGGDV